VHWEKQMDRPRAADDFAAIRARMKELEQERQVVRRGDKKPSDARRRQIAEDVRGFLNLPGGRSTVT
jgi:hypothetical protein